MGNIAVVISLTIGALVFENILHGLMLVAAAQVLFQIGMIVYFAHIARMSENPDRTF